MVSSSCGKHMCVHVCAYFPKGVLKVGCKLSDASLQERRSGDVECDGTGRMTTA